MPSAMNHVARAIAAVVLACLAAPLTAAAADQICDIDVYRYAYGSNAAPEELKYGVEIDIYAGLDTARTLRMSGPKGLMFSLNNPAKIRTGGLDDEGLSIHDFQAKYPPGKYRCFFGFPRQNSPWVDLTHDFPPFPTILTPEDGTTDIPAGEPLSITWEPLETDPWLWVTTWPAAPNKPTTVDYDPLVISGNSQLTLPAGVLGAGKIYQLCLGVDKPLDGWTGSPDENHALESMRCITISTAP